LRILTLGFLTLNFPPAGNAPPLDTVKAAAAAGFKSVGLRIAGRRPGDDYPPVVGNAAAIRDIRKRLSDAGMRLSSAIGYGFFPDVALGDQARILDATAELGGDTVMINVFFDDHDAFAGTLNQFCALAAARRIRVAIEFMPFSGLKTIEDADRLITASKARNAGIVVDSLHLARSGGVPADVKKIASERIYLGQICDGKNRADRPTDDELRAEARAHRLYPGEGDFPIMELIDTLPAEMEIEYEVPRSDQTGMPLVDRAKKAAQIFFDYMATYEKHRAGNAGRSRS
jgi:sugar phosphate isomerase/epimerase